VFPMSDHDGPSIYEKIPPSLRHLSFDWLFLDDHRWNPLTTFLSHRASTGNPIISLAITNSPHICRWVVEVISGMVGEVMIHQDHLHCPFGFCQGSR